MPLCPRLHGELQIKVYTGHCILRGSKFRSFLKCNVLKNILSHSYKPIIICIVLFFIVESVKSDQCADGPIYTTQIIRQDGSSV